MSACHTWSSIGSSTRQAYEPVASSASSTAQRIRHLDPTVCLLREFSHKTSNKARTFTDVKAQGRDQPYNFIFPSSFYLKLNSILRPKGIRLSMSLTRSCIGKRPTNMVALQKPNYACYCELRYKEIVEAL
ncbi:hypothetical protein LB507_003835 [Fusarium sp. FIESC RH6]|nr:hypothetical protein LB507_003835 [Fusarium sp. FIESC RH6]